MTVTKKVYATGVIIATILVITAAVTTTASFPNVTTVFATLQAPEQLGENATTGTTTAATPPSAGGGQEQQQQQQQSIQITKTGTSSYLLSGASSHANIGSFYTTYTVVGERFAIRSAENLIISTITSDFRSSPTTGYIRTGNVTTTGATPESPHSSPPATPEQITERITSELRRAISEAENSRVVGQYSEIMCNFGMTLDEMRCHQVLSPGGITFLENLPLEPDGLTATNTTDTTASIAPLEGEE